MIEISPISTTHPIKRIKKIVRERDKQPDKNQSEEPNKEGDDNSNDPQQQHIDETV